jgi:hypothetical protein
MWRALGECIEALSPTFGSVVKGCAVGALALVLILDASVQEFAELVSLSSNARRERFNLPAACTPTVSAVKSTGPSSSRLTVFVDCGAGTARDSQSGDPVSWKDK